MGVSSLESSYFSAICIDVGWTLCSLVVIKPDLITMER